VRPVSLLTLPLGAGTVLDHLVSQVEKVGHGEILVLSSCLSATDPVFKRSGTLPVRPVQLETLAQKLERYEASDYLLVVDPRLWPTTGYQFEECQHLTEEYHGATHMIALGGHRESTRERVERDENGNVRRVQRLYAPKNWSEVSGANITCSMAPLRAAIGIRFVFPLELRAALSAMGVLSRDVALNCDVFRLGTESGFLALSERIISDVCRQEVEGFEKRGEEVLVGRDCQIGRDVRLVGPIIIQPGAVIEAGVTVIGPAVIGTNSRILPRATVIQSVLARGTLVSEDATVRQQVGCEICPEEKPDKTPLRVHDFGLALAGTSEPGGADSAEWGAVSPAQHRVLHRGIKRGMDVLLSACALVVLSPLLLVVALAIKIDSRGRVFFAHRREGRNGREFPCWKFRTMVADAHQRQRGLYEKSEVDGPQFKLRDDPRVTRVGRWLRSTNIDELPQLFNVFLGHMSLVGPRPSPFRENQICVPWRRARLSVRPGITGLWQVCRDGDRLRGDFHEWIFYDMTYVRHFSVWLDLKILLATVATLGGRWSVPFSWLLPKVVKNRDVHRYSVSAA